MKVTIPVLYEDSGMRVLPGDEHNPPLMIHNVETVEFETKQDGSRLVRITLPPGRSWVVLPEDLFSDKITKGWSKRPDSG